jgi:uncharacterized RDD family membrane protein YckC
MQITKTHSIDRFFAKGLDLIILSFIALFFKLIWSPLGAVAAISYALMHDAMGGGRSIGKRLLGLRVVNKKDASDITIEKSILRNLSFGLFTLFAMIPFMGWILMLILGLPLLIFEAYLVYHIETNDRLGDVLAQTKVIREEKKASRNKK